MADAAANESGKLPSRRHSWVAWGKMAWLVAILFTLAAALFLRVLGCAAHGNWLTDQFCSFRRLGAGMLLVDLGLLAALITFTASYDPLRRDRESVPPWRKPDILFVASVRALRRKDTPHRWKHRLGFWAFLLLILSFAYLVYWAHFVFWS